MELESKIEVADWVRAAQDGDRTAFGRLVECYQEAVFVQCLRLAPNRADAEDLAHDAFVQAFTQIGQLQDPHRFGGWLKVIALNLCRSHFRQQYQKVLPLETEPTGRIKEPPDERWEQVEENLWRLSPTQRLVLALHYWEGFSYEEIARFTGVPPGTVMSRLHRARSNLREGIEENGTCNGETPMNSGPDLRREIDAEIEALGRLFADDPESMERLSVLLRHSPARFGRLIEEMVPAEVDPLVILLKRLGAPAMAVALDSYFGGDDSVRQRALTLLRALIAQDQNWHYYDQDWSNAGISSHATQTTYALLDRIIARSVPEVDKVELLLELVEAAPPGLIRRLCEKVMLCYPQTVFNLLRKRLEEREELSVQPPPLEMTILPCFGTTFCRYLLDLLDDDRSEIRQLGLAGLVALSNQLNPRWMLAEEAVERERSHSLFRDYWHLLSRDLEPAVFDALLDRVLALLPSEEAETREAAILVLGSMRRSDKTIIEALCRCLDHAERPTRLVALKALCEIGAVSSNSRSFIQNRVEERILTLAQIEDRTEQVAALTALGRLRVESARSLLTERARTAACRDVCEAAVNGLGQIGGEESVTLLRQLQMSGSKDLRKKASRWLQRLAEGTAESNSTPTTGQKRRARFMGEDTQSVPFPTHHSSINPGGAIRSLPEVRVYPEMELTRLFAQVSRDYAFTRRLLADRGLLHREEGMCTLTETGQGVWRVEHHIQDSYLRGIR
jgi:RNA polymerase sigma-70 factor, ECF subfamily